MKPRSFKIKQLKGKISSLINLVKLGIKKYIIQLLDSEAELADAQSNQLFSEQQIKSAFIKAAGDFRYWKDEMLVLIPLLVGVSVRACDPWQHWEKFTPIQEMVELGWRDRVIALAIDTANSLG